MDRMKNMHDNSLEAGGAVSSLLVTRNGQLEQIKLKIIALNVEYSEMTKKLKTKQGEYDKTSVQFKAEAKKFEKQLNV